MTEIKGIGATLIWDGEMVTIKHRGLGRVTVPVKAIIGMDLSEPRWVHMGKFTIKTTSAQHSGLMPKEPLTVPFGKRQLDAFRALYAALNAVNAGTLGNSIRPQTGGGYADTDPLPGLPGAM